MSDMVVVAQNFLFEQGLNYLHLAQSGQPVDLSAAVQQYIPLHCQQGYVARNGLERTKQLYHLELMWPYRDVVRVRPWQWAGDESALCNGVFWRRGGRERMREVIQAAADLYWGYFDAAPCLVVAQNLPTGAPERVELGGACGAVSVPMLAREWMPRAAVLVCGPILPETL